MNTNLLNTMNVNVIPKFPTIQSLFPSNFITLNTTLPTTTITNNVPFSFGINNQFCSQNVGVNNLNVNVVQPPQANINSNNNVTPTNPNANNLTENKSSDQLLKEGIITSQIPKLPLMTQLQIN